ncbi:MAG TPA: sensor domain-containing diguanylate cyclase [Acidimicrobiales bacterium]|nr:sensor domain-containing diguanylate cyclase [Acidimicrobiales bacterium]
MTPRAVLVPLADRLAAVQRTRVLLALVVAASAATLGDVLGDPSVPLVPLSAAYVLVSAGVEGLRRLSGRRGLPVLSASLVLDGAYLAVAVASTGGAGSPLLFLVLLHVVAAVLLLSFRSGILVSTWHAALLAVAHHLDLVPGDEASFRRVLVAAGSFVVVAAACSAFASLNERELRRSRRSATSLVSLGSALESCRSVTDVAAASAEHLRAGLGHRRAAVLVRRADHWVGASDEGRGVVLIRTGLARDVLDLSGAEPRLVAELDPDDELLDRVLPGARNVAVVPLVADGERVGVAVVECGPGRSRLAVDEVAVLVQSAHRIAQTIRTRQLLHEIERLAASDPLTGLPNRRMFDATLDREVARSRRNGTPLALAVADVDHFKAVNDQHGHQVGDEVLRELAGALRRAVRQEDVVARYGGEEFVVLLPDADEGAALLVAERLRAAAGEVRRLPTSISVGVAVLDPGAGGAGLVARADTALYRAKAAGRDRVVLWRSDALVSGAPDRRMPDPA